MGGEGSTVCCPSQHACIIPALTHGCMSETNLPVGLKKHADTLLGLPHLDDQSTIVVICSFETCVQKSTPVAGQKHDPITRERGG